MFKKGQSGNPKGRGTAKVQQKRIAADLLSPLVDRAVSAINRALDDDDQAAWAAKLIFDYVYGRPMQAVELKGEMTTKLQFTDKPPTAEEFMLLYAPEPEGKE